MYFTHFPPDVVVSMSASFWSTHVTFITNVPLLGIAKHYNVDGGPSMEPHHEAQGSPRSLSICSQVKEMVQAFLHQHSDPPGYSPMHKPDFVYLLEGDPDGVISCTPHFLQA